MKIAVVSKADAKGGGASKVAEDLATGLSSIGHEVLHLVSWSSKGYADGLSNAYGSKEHWVRKAHAVARRVGAGELIGIDVRAVMTELARFKPDVVHFHDTSGCFSVPLLEAVSATYKTFWTFHDCSPFTGGCLYDMGCAKLTDGCGDCPRTGEWPIDGFVDMTAKRYKLKHALFEKGMITAIAPSDWMAERAVSDGKLTVRPKVLSNGVDIDVFNRSPVDIALNTGEGLRILLSAGSLADSRKGIRHAVAVVRALSKSVACTVSLVGNPDASIERELAGIPFQGLGFVSGSEPMARAYGASEVFLLCSLADNQPLAVLEALSMGMVIGAYACGGVTGMIEDSVNGILSPVGHPETLAQKILQAREAGRFASIQAAARTAAVSKHSMASFIASHETLYMEFLK